MIYSDKIIKLYQQANLKPLFECGDGVKKYCYGDESSGLYIIFQTKYNNGLISDCRYKIMGCGYAIALCVWLEQQLINQPTTKLKLLELKDLIDEFDLPQTKHKVAIAILDIYQRVLNSNA